MIASSKVSVVIDDWIEFWFEASCSHWHVVLFYELRGSEWLDVYFYIREDMKLSCDLSLFHIAMANQADFK